MTTRKIEENLVKLGLKKVEARAYIALARLGTAVASRIAKEAGIPLSKIYDILRGLEEKGLIESQESRPKVYRITDPNRGLKSLIKQYETTLAETLEMIKEIRVSGEPEATGVVWTVRGRRNIISRMCSLFNEASYGLAIATTDYILSKVMDKIVAVANKGVNISLVIYQTDPKLVEYLVNISRAFSKVKVRRIVTVTVLLIDRKKGFSYFIPPELSPESKVNMDYALIIEDENLLRLLNDFYHLALWNISELKAFDKKSIFSRPLRYVHFWRLVEDVKELLSMGVNVKARIVGRYVVNKRHVDITGEIKDVLISENGLKYSLIIETDDGRRFSVGGWGCYLEDIETDKAVIYVKF